MSHKLTTVAHEKEEEKDASKTLRTFRRNVSGFGPLFFGPNSSLSRSLEYKK